jgi:hypothetical protein
MRDPAHVVALWSKGNAHLQEILSLVHSIIVGATLVVVLLLSFVYLIDVAWASRP